MVTPFFFQLITSFTGFLHFAQKQKILNIRSFNFIAISTQIRLKFSTNAGIHDLQLKGSVEKGHN